MTANARLQDLTPIVGAEHVLVEEDLRAPYETDWIRRWSGRAAAVVRPGTTEEVGAVVAACDAAGSRSCRGAGNTGMVGAGVPRGPGDGRPQIVLSLAALDPGAP